MSLETSARRVATAWLSRSGMEHTSPDALKKYLKDHPDADRSKHHVKKPSEDGGKKDESGKKTTAPAGKADFSGENPKGMPAKSRPGGGEEEMVGELYGRGRGSFALHSTGNSKPVAPDKLKAALSSHLELMTAGEMKDMHKSILRQTNKSTKMKQDLTKELEQKADKMESEHGMSLAYQVEDAVEALAAGKEYTGDLFDYIDKPTDVAAKLKKAEAEGKEYQDVADWMATEARKHLKGGGKQSARLKPLRRLAHLRRCGAVGGYVLDRLRAANGEVGTAAGGLHYRLYDRSGRRDMEGNDYLTDSDRRVVGDAHSKLEKIRTELADITRKLIRVDLHYGKVARLDLWTDRKTSPKGVPYPRSKWDKSGVFGWSTPAPNMGGGYPEPWRIANLDAALADLKKAFRTDPDIYVDHHGQVQGRETIWVGLRDNRDKVSHLARIDRIAQILKTARFPHKRSSDGSHILLLDDIKRDALR